MDKPTPNIDESLERLRKVVDTHITLQKHTLSHHMVTFDIFLTGVVQRSISLIHGFVSMVESRNPLCAFGLFRMQLDTLMRLHGCTLVDDINGLVHHVLKGKPFYKLKARDGAELRDSYLRQKLAEHLPWVTHAYNVSSEFIHLSDRHIRSTIQPSKAGTLSFFISKTNPEWRDKDVIETIDYFGKTTDAILGLCYEYMLGKNKTNAKVDLMEDKREAENAE